MLLRWAWWPRLAYDDGCALQDRLRAARLDGGEDCAVATEHDPVVTLGRRAGVGELQLSRAELERRGVAVRETSRGGLATYHGPGQVVLYPIADVRTLGIRGFVRLLEDAALAIVEAAGLGGARRPGQPGVWVAEAKVASIGIHVRRGISMHGVAVNLAGPLEPFGWIRACGMTDGRVAALDELGGRRLDLHEAAALGVAVIARGLGAQAAEVAPALLDPPG